MANATADTAQVVYSTVTAVVRWSGGSTLLRKGQGYASDDPLVVERPGMFAPFDPTDKPRSTVPAAPQRRCWVCKQAFSPSAGHSRYCSKGCRRTRERWLARMARTVTRGAAGDPKRPGADCTPTEARAYRAAVEAHAAALMRFAAYMSGRCDPADSEWTGPRTPDPDIAFVPPKRAELAERARGQAARLSHAVNDARAFEAAVDERARASTVARPGPDRVAQLAALDDAVSRWAKKLEGEDGDV